MGTRGRRPAPQRLARPQPRDAPSWADRPRPCHRDARCASATGGSGRLGGRGGVARIGRVLAAGAIARGRCSANTPPTWPLAVPGCVCRPSVLYRTRDTSGHFDALEPKLAQWSSFTRSARTEVAVFSDAVEHAARPVAIPSAFRYPLAVSGSAPAEPRYIESAQPKRSSTRTCRVFS